jgi:hypothetical protein
MPGFPKLKRRQIPLGGLTLGRGLITLPGKVVILSSLGSQTMEGKTTICDCGHRRQQHIETGCSARLVVTGAGQIAWPECPCWRFQAEKARRK